MHRIASPRAPGSPEHPPAPLARFYSLRRAVGAAKWPWSKIIQFVDGLPCTKTQFDAFVEDRDVPCATYCPRSRTPETKSLWKEVPAENPEQDRTKTRRRGETMVDNHHEPCAARPARSTQGACKRLKGKLLVVAALVALTACLAGLAACGPQEQKAEGPEGGADGQQPGQPGACRFEGARRHRELHRSGLRLASRIVLHVGFRQCRQPRMQRVPRRRVGRHLRPQSHPAFGHVQAGLWQGGQHHGLLSLPCRRRRPRRTHPVRPDPQRALQQGPVRRGRIRQLLELPRHRQRRQPRAVGRLQAHRPAWRLHSVGFHGRAVLAADAQMGAQQHRRRQHRARHAGGRLVRPRAHHRRGLLRGKQLCGARSGRRNLGVAGDGPDGKRSRSRSRTSRRCRRRRRPSPSPAPPTP